jgi:uncharacterized spore protein YtfJ
VPCLSWVVLMSPAGGGGGGGGVSLHSVYFFLFGGGDVWVLRIHPWRCGIQAPVLLEMVCFV